MLYDQVRDLLKEKDRVIVAIDGPCGSGKSTLAGQLAADFPDSALYHADDFFLQPHQRSLERLACPGGNLDRERLLAEVLLGIQSGQPFAYHKYHCQTGQMQAMQASPARLNIVEGSYSHHPDLKPFYDLTIYLEASLDTRLARLRSRVPLRQLDAFLQTWIPLENQYFKAFDIKATSDLILAGD